MVFPTIKNYYNFFENKILILILLKYISKWKFGLVLFYRSRRTSPPEHHALFNSFSLLVAKNLDPSFSILLHSVHRASSDRIKPVNTKY